MRNDGTVEEVDAPNAGGFLSRISSRLINFINSILGALNGENDTLRFDGYSNEPSSSNEIERELIKLANNNKKVK